MGKMGVGGTQGQQCRRFIRSILSRSEFWTLKKPEALPTKLKSMFRVPDLKKMLRVFRGEEIQGTAFGCEIIVASAIHRMECRVGIW